MENPWIRVEYQKVKDLDIGESDRQLLYERHGDKPIWFEVYFSWKPHQTIVFGEESVSEIIKKHPECAIYYKHKDYEKRSK